jgi:hypothetical protein
MNRKVLAFAATCLFAALIVASPFSAAQVATTKSIRIDSDVRGSEHCTGKFLLQLGTDGDAGKVECTRTFGNYKKTPEGLEFLPYRETTTFTGKAGTLVLRSDGRSWEVGFGSYVSTSGTWSVVSGTGAYAGMQGRGRSVGVHSSAKNLNQTRYAGLVKLQS